MAGLSSAQITNSSGSLVIAEESTLATYACAGFVTPGAAPTDVITLAGSATKTIHIMQVRVNLEATAAGTADVQIYRRSSADTGGTSTTITPFKFDTNNAAATAVCTVYTANPSGLGTGTTVLAADRQTGTQGLPVVWTFGYAGIQSVVLRGTSDFIVLNGNGDTLLSGEVWSFNLVWTEQ